MTDTSKDTGLDDEVRGIITKNTLSIEDPTEAYLPHIHEIDFEATVTDLLHMFRATITTAVTAREEELAHREKEWHEAGFEDGRTEDRVRIREEMKGMFRPEESVLHGDMDEARYHFTKGYNDALNRVLALLEDKADI